MSCTETKRESLGLRSLAGVVCLGGAFLPRDDGFRDPDNLIFGYCVRRS